MAIADHDLIIQINEVMAFDTMTSVELFTLRLLLHDNDPGINLQQDLAELALFPERLLTSHRHEWISYCRKQLFMACQKQRFADSAHAAAYLQVTRQLIVEANQRDPEPHEKTVNKDSSQADNAYASYAKKINEAETLLKSDNVALLESPPSRKIRKLIG